MTMTDPIADMLTRLRNGNVGYHDSVVMPSSKIKVEIAKVLQQEGYVMGYEVQEAPVGKVLRIDLKYGPNRERTISGVRRISKPGLRHYVKKEELPRVLGGLGIAIISTSTGLLTDRAAHKAGIGGEVLAYVW
jgi:small subunit ribosomal protein S8